MKEKINIELAKLQKELGNLETAVSQISKAEKISTEVVKSIQELNVKYDTQFTKLIEEFDKYLSESIKKTESKYIETVNKNQEVINQLIALSTSQSENSKQIFDSLQKDTETLIVQTQEQTQHLIEQHSIQVEEVNKLLKSYLELAQSTTKLTDQLNSVDFPIRLDKIYANIGEMNTEIRRIQSMVKLVAEDPRIFEIQEKVKKNSKKLNFLTILTIITLLFILGLSYELIFSKYVQFLFN